VTVGDFSSLATCYAEVNGRVRPEAVIGYQELSEALQPIAGLAQGLNL
jgi:hypothetical protein